MPKSYTPSVPGIKSLLIWPPTITLSSTPSPKLILPVAVILPLTLILPVPVILLPFKSKFDDNVGFVSLTSAPETKIPPCDNVGLGEILPPTNN